MSRFNTLRELMSKVVTTQDVAVERRESPRYKVVLFARQRGQGEFWDFLGNVGIGGFYLEGDELLEEGTEMEIFFQLPGTCTWILTRGVVASGADLKFGFGLRGRFTEITFEKERHLARWLDQMSLNLQANAA
jgi:hypothetical protein